MAAVVVIVAGGREYSDRERLFSALDFWRNRIEITRIVLPWVQQKRCGAHQLAAAWAKARGVPLDEEVVSLQDWKTLGTAAEPTGNRKMFDRHNPQWVIDFLGGPETADLLAMARQRGVRCVEVC